MKRHKHYEQILAFIEGKTVLVRSRTEYSWEILSHLSDYNEYWEYEIVPDKLVRYVAVNCGSIVSLTYQSKDECEKSMAAVGQSYRVIKMVEEDDQDGQ